MVHYLENTPRIMHSSSSYTPQQEHEYPRVQCAIYLTTNFYIPFFLVSRKQKEVYQTQKGGQ
jgi:hypothetical protein